MVTVQLKSRFAVAKIHHRDGQGANAKREIMKKAKKKNQFDLKNMIDLVQGFNASIMRITCNQSQDERAKLINSLGQRMIDLGNEMAQVTSESIKS